MSDSSITANRQVAIDVPRWGRYVSDPDLFNAEMARTRADLLAEVLDRCATERGDSSFLRTLRKIHLAGMLADFATGARRNAEDMRKRTTPVPVLTVRQTPASVGNPAYDQTFAGPNALGGPADKRAEREQAEYAAQVRERRSATTWIVYRTDTGATVTHYASAEHAIRHATGANKATGLGVYGVDQHYPGDDDGPVRHVCSF